jgi:tRNA(adenine34) deaminase
MELALEQAQKAFNRDEVPVGAVIVHKGRVIGKGFNEVIKKNSVIYHAEINAIIDASRSLDNYRLNNCEIYVTLEPCHMCAKAIVDARIECLFYGASESKTGAVQSIDKFLTKSQLNHKVSSSGGYLQEESINLLRDFFESKRN